ncbi:aldo/keto reductase [Marivivens marinus]|uniref:aldo/keto reductase n=1 Tax=Marivivens marinus TaxID=3110173 RepID=UPI003B848E7C
MQTRTLGQNGPTIPAIGLGCMSFAGAFGAARDEDSFHCLDAAVDAGITFLDTANIYGAGRSEEVLGRWLKSTGARVTLATKGGITRDPARPTNNDPAYLRAELEGSLSRLGVDRVDLYYVHRRDPSVPLEDTIGGLANLVAEGKIGGYGLSEVAPHTIRAAHAIHPCLAVQSEYSLWTRLPELGVLQTCETLGISLVAFAPLARGMLGRVAPDPATMGENDLRRDIPRFSPANYPANLAHIQRFRTLAKEMGQTPSALALAWLLSRSDRVIPIPGTRTAEHLSDWADADRINLSAEDMARIESVLPAGFAHGDRYSEDQWKSVERYC